MTHLPSVEVNRLINEEMQNFHQPVIVEHINKSDRGRALYRPSSTIQDGEETARALVDQELDNYRTPEAQREEESKEY